jgi:DNA-binding SARP family transcriptional activator
MGLSEPVAARYRFTVLGPIRAWRGGLEIDLGSPQQCAVLSMLLSRCGRFLSAEEIVYGGPPATAWATARTYISRLRRALSDDPKVTIKTTSGGYVLELTNASVDAAEFDSLLESSREYRASGNVALAAEQLEKALALWSGAALAGVPGHAAERERTRLEQMRLVATKELLELKLELGRHVEVMVEIPAVIIANNWDEQLREIYMLALYRYGRQVDALDEYRKVRTLLSQELGIEPGPGLRSLHERILRADPSLNLAASVASSQEPPTERAEDAGVGPSADARLDRRMTLGVRLQAQRHRLFVGRERQRQLFGSALASGSGDRFVLYFKGFGGMGKSALLQRLADDAQEAGRSVVRVDARDIGPTHNEFEAAAAPALMRPDSVLMIDAFEALQALEPSFWTDSLRTLPRRTVVVIAGRSSPRPSWQAGSAAAGGPRVETLRELPVQDARTLLELRGVPGDKWDSILNFAGGHPLALSLAAEAALTADSAVETFRTRRDITDVLLSQVVGVLPSPAHRIALHVCAHSYGTTEDLLRSVLPEGQPAELFEWLRDLSFVESAGQGVEVHHLVRRALEFDLRWRDPVGYQTMHQRIRCYQASTCMSREMGRPTRFDSAGCP